MKAIRFRIEPNAAQREAIDQAIDANRRVYNNMVTACKIQYNRDGKTPSVFDLNRMGTRMRRNAPYVAEAYSLTLNGTSKRVVQAFKKTLGDHEKETGMLFVETVEFMMHGDHFLRYKSLNQFNSITYPSTRDYSIVTEKKDGKRRRFLRLGKVPGLIRCYNQSTEIKGDLRTCTVKRKDMGSHTEYYASIAYEPSPKPYREPLKGPVGIDIGISNIVAFSDGEKVKNDHIFFHLASTLRKFQQRLSRLSPDTKMYGRIQTRINHLYEKIKNHRKNNVETISAHIVKDYGPIVMEDLSVMQIRKRARSRFMTNGYNDASLGYLRRRIQDKASSAGREIILVDPKGTSQTCSACSCQWSSQSPSRIAPLFVCTWSIISVQFMSASSSRSSPVMGPLVPVISFIISHAAL